MFEKVNPCHPDKLADRIAGALVDLAYAKSENPYSEIVNIARKYIARLGGFEKFAEWGIIR